MTRSSTRFLTQAAVLVCLIGLPGVAVLASGEIPGDPHAGAQAFTVCGACHTTQPGGAALIGPNLWSVVNRPVASVEGFDYSPALKAVGGAWTVDRLDRFLTAPMEFVPGTRMGFLGIGEAAERANIVAYLATLVEGAGSVAAPVVDYGPDWPAGPGQTEAGQLCNSCHSLAIVKQQRLSRSTWDKLLHWMVDEQGMAEQTPESRELLLDYLSEHFGAPE